MSLLSPIACMMGRHAPHRRRVSWDGKTYKGHCKHCGREIERVTHRNWRVSSSNEAAQSE